MPPTVLSCLRRTDAGQVTVLIIGYFLIAALLVTVVVNVSRVFLVRRALSGTADGAAVAAANGLDETAIYGGELGVNVPLSGARAADLVADYVAVAGPQVCDAWVVDVDADADVASVTLACTVQLPFVNMVSAGYAGGVLVTATASARSPVG